MSATLPSNSNCCLPQCDDSTPSQVPGPQGPAGENGTNGTDGINATSLTTDSFIQPAVNSSVSVEVVVSSWATAGQIVFVQGGGDYFVDSVPDSTHMVLINLGYPNNSVPTTVVPTSSSISPSGQRGEQGESGATITLDDISPTTTRGDLLVDNGANSPDPSVVRMAAGTNGTVLVSDSTQPTGRRDVAITQNGETDNLVPRFDASGSTTPTPLQNSKVLITDDGAIQSTPTGGNARGTNATDLQVSRGAANKVASGLLSVLTGGADNRASGDYSSAVGGSNNSATGNYSAIGGGVNNIASGNFSSIPGGNTNVASGVRSSVIGGFENTASAQDASVNGGSGNLASGVGSVISGGTQNEASGANSGIFGGNQALADKSGQISFANGSFSAPGDAQWSRLLFRNSTTDATPTNLFLDGVSARLTISTDRAWGFKGLILGAVDNGDSALYEIIGLVKNVSGTTSIVGSVTVTSLFSDGGWPGGAGVAVTADDGNDALDIQVTGAVATNIKWSGFIEFSEIGFA